MSQHVYEASVYSRTITYRNLQGAESEVELYFLLDPIQLLQVIADFNPKKSKSANPAKKDELEMTDAEMLKFLRDIAQKSAGYPSTDGESWEPIENFLSNIAGQAFITKLASSDGDRKEFADKVMLDPFRAFVGYAVSDESNSKAEVSQFKDMLAKLENIFKVDDSPQGESREERRARLMRELEETNGPAEGTQGENGINSPGNI